MLLRADWVFDDALVRGLAKSADDVALVADSGECVAQVVPAARADEAAQALLERRAPPGLRAVNAADIADGYNKTLRKREAPYLMPLDAAGAAGDRAARLRRASTRA